DYSWFQKPAEKEVDDDDFDDLLQKTQKMQWHGFSDIRPDDAVVDGRLISFSDGSFGVFTEGFSFTRIPSDENQSLASVSASDLNIGDIVIFGGSDHNLLISESAKLLASEGHEDSLTIASSWRDAIRSAQNSGMSDNAIIKEMQKNGIIRSDAIFRQWLDSESSIVCPRNKEDLERISLALNDELLFEMADEIVEHAKIVYSARIRTGKFLMKKLMENLDVASAISKLHSSNEFTSESFVIDVAGIGKVQIVSIVETGQIEKFPQRIINQRKVF
ncbi:MAG: DrmE family protein, partial [Candidatus Enteromonas sp.]